MKLPKILFGIIAAVFLSVGMLQQGCTQLKSAPTTTYKVSTGAHVTAKAALSAWNDYLAVHVVPPEVETKVRDTYRKYQAAQLLALDAAIAVKDWQEGAGDIDALNAQFTQAAANSAQAFSDLLTLLTNLGVKL